MTAGTAFELTGGRLCLDFANTVDNRPVERRRDLLPGYADLVAWSVQADVLAGRGAARLLARAARRPSDARRALARALTLREAIYAIFSAIAAGHLSRAADEAVLNRELAAAMARSRVVREREGYEWGFGGSEDALDRMVWPVARSAAELLTSADLARVRECAADDCGWLFVDESKNRSRRWCNMNVCGNRAKARRHYARTRRR